MTSGGEIKRQVMEALPVGSYGYHARAALAPCVVLAAEEQERVREVFSDALDAVAEDGDVDEVFAILGFTTLGAGGALPGPSDGVRSGQTSLLAPDPDTFAPRDPHAYVTREPGYTADDMRRDTMTPSSGAVVHDEPARGNAAPDDIGPPAPGEGDDLPNPEIGMEC